MNDVLSNGRLSGAPNAKGLKAKCIDLHFAFSLLIGVIGQYKLL